MDSHHEYKLRRVMDVDSIRDDPGGLEAFTGMIGYLISSDMLNVTFERDADFKQSLDIIMNLLMDQVLQFVCYGDPHDPTQWKLEAGPNLRYATVLPIDINLN